MRRDPYHYKAYSSHLKLKFQITKYDFSTIAKGHTNAHI